jgi:hypothetical protein
MRQVFIWFGSLAAAVSCFASPPPIITAQPSDTVVLEAGTASFSVTATSGTTLSYQWYFGSSAIGGATTSNLTVQSVTVNNSGTYYVAVRNAGGTVNSRQATLTVMIAPPVANNQSLTLPVNSPTNLVLTATDAGGRTLTYSIVSWPTNGLLTGLNTNTGAVTYTPTTNYVGADSFTFAASDGSRLGMGQVSLNILAPPTITTQPQGQTLWAGQNCSLSSTSTGSSPLSYQWQLNGAALLGATNSSLTWANVYPTNSGSYTLVVTNPVGSVTSAVASLTVIDGSYRLAQAWMAQYGSNHNAYAVDAVLDGQGNVYVTGYSQPTNANNDYTTLKYDSNGNLLWQRFYDAGPGNNSQPAALAVDNSGNVYVTGASQGTGTGWDYATVKYDGNGNTLWIARYNGVGNKDDQAAAIAVDTNGNILVTGWSMNASGHHQYATVKYDSSGNQLWVGLYANAGSNEDDAKSLAVDPAGNVVVTGQSKGSTSDYDYATVKYSSNGAQLWVARYNGPGNKADSAIQVIVDAAGNSCVTGTSINTNSQTGYATVKYDANGNQLWVGRYDSPNGKPYTAAALAVDGGGNVFVTGSASVTNGGGNDYATVKYNPAGQQLWAQLYSNGQDDQAIALGLDSAGDVYVTGKSQGSVTGYDIATVKYASGDGTQKAVMRYNSSGNVNDTPVAVVIDNQFNVYVAGQGFNPLNYILLKYQPSCLAPAVVALWASNITVASVVLNATVNAQGSPMTCYFSYGVTTNYGLISSGLSGFPPGSNAVTTAISGLESGTLYHYCLVASNAAGVTVSADATFTTSVGPPSGSTMSATSVSAGSAVLNAQVTQQLLSLTCAFQYGETTNYGTVSSSTLLPGITGLGGILPVSAAISGLAPNTVYHYRLVVTGIGGTTFGQDATFQTLSLPPMQLGGALSMLSSSAGNMQLTLTSTPGATLTVLSSSNFVNWTVVGTMTEVSPGQYQFTDPQPATNPSCFYRLRSP